MFAILLIQEDWSEDEEEPRLGSKLTEELELEDWLARSEAAGNEAEDELNELELLELSVTVAGCTCCISKAGESAGAWTAGSA